MHDEDARIHALRRYDILDTLPNPEFNRIVNLAARHFSAPIALISLIDRDRLWFKASNGVALSEIQRKDSFCNEALQQDDVYVVLDAAKNETHQDHMVLASGLEAHFYAGAPLRDKDGFVLGTLCVLDGKPRASFSENDKALLSELADVVIDHIEMRYSNAAKIEQGERFLHSVLENVHGGVIACDADGNLSLFNKAARELHGIDSKPIAPKDWSKEYDLFEADGVTPLDMHRIPLFRALNGEMVDGQEMVISPKGLQPHTVTTKASLMLDEMGEKVGAIASMHDITNERMAEKMSWAADARYRAIFDNTIQFCSMLSLDGRVIEINQTALKFSGIEADSVKGLYIWDTPWMPQDDDMQIEFKKAVKLASSGKYENGETVITGEDGKATPIDYSISPVWGEGGKVINLIAEGRNISDRRDAEEKLRRNQAELELIFNNIPLLILYKDDKNNILRANRAVADSLGRTVEEVEGKHTSELYPDFAEKYLEDDLEVIRSGEPKIGIVEEYETDAGTRGWVRTDKVPYTDPETGNRFVFAAATDISAERSIEVALRESDQRYRNIYNKTPIMLHSTDMEGNLLSVSDYWLKNLGYERSEVIGRKASEFLVPETSPSVVTDWITRLSENGECEDLELQVRSKSGDHIDVLLSAVGEMDESGAMVSLLAVLTDITERKIVERQFLQAQKMESVGQLTGGLAHDFNNLLGVVLGNLQLIERSIGDDPRSKRRIDAACDAVDRGAELTRRLLAFSRKQKLETESVEVVPLVSGMSTILERVLGENISLECVFSDPTPNIRSDSSQLESALLNLAVNARDAMPGGGHLTIETEIVVLDEENTSSRHNVAPGTYVMIAVTDTGEGISADKLQNVFEPFFTTKDVGKGSGLGLSMVYGFTKQSGGYASIYSEVNLGTTVRLYLPVDKEVDAPVVLEMPQRPLVPHCANGEIILVVEDQPDVREVAASMLEDLGYTVLTADCGDTALLVLAERTDIDLMFTDMVMPGGMDGSELAQRAQYIYPDLPIVFTTGYADAAVLREGKISKTHNLVTKPYRKSDLARKIGGLLEKSFAEAKKIGAMR